MKRIMSLLVVLVFAASCGGGGGNSGSALQEIDNYLAGNQFTQAYRITNPSQEYEHGDPILNRDSNFI